MEINVEIVIPLIISLVMTVNGLVILKRRKMTIRPRGGSPRELEGTPAVLAGFGYAYMGILLLILNLLTIFSEIMPTENLLLLNMMLGFMTYFIIAVVGYYYHYLWK